MNSRDVIFDEMMAWSWEDNTSQAPRTSEILEPSSTQEEFSHQPSPRADHQDKFSRIQKLFQERYPL